MFFLVFLSVVVLTAHIFSPLGAIFVAWLNSQNPHLVGELSPYMRYWTELLLLHIPAAIIVTLFWLRTHISDRLPVRHPFAFKIIFGGLFLYFLFVVGRTMEGQFGNTLHTYLALGLLLSRSLLIAGCITLLLNLQSSGSQESAGGASPPDKKGGDEDALAALMGMMGGGGGPPGGGGGKAPPGRRRK